MSSSLVSMKNHLIVIPGSSQIEVPTSCSKFDAQIPFGKYLERIRFVCFCALYAFLSLIFCAFLHFSDPMPTKESLTKLQCEVFDQEEKVALQKLGIQKNEETIEKQLSQKGNLEKQKEELVQKKKSLEEKHAVLLAKKRNGEKSWHALAAAAAAGSQSSAVSSSKEKIVPLEIVSYALMPPNVAIEPRFFIYKFKNEKEVGRQKMRDIGYGGLRGTLPKPQKYAFSIQRGNDLKYVWKIEQQMGRNHFYPDNYTISSDRFFEAYDSAENKKNFQVEISNRFWLTLRNTGRNGNTYHFELLGYRIDNPPFSCKLTFRLPGVHMEEREGRTYAASLQTSIPLKVKLGANGKTELEVVTSCDGKAQIMKFQITESLLNELNQKRIEAPDQKSWSIPVRDSNGSEIVLRFQNPA